MSKFCNAISGTLLSVLTLGAYAPREVFEGDPFLKVSPRNIGVAYEQFDCFFHSESGIHVINGWYIPPIEKQLDHPMTFFICGDIKGNMSHNLDLVKFLTITFPTHAIVVFDYVGFGLSSCDKASFDMCLASAVRALEHTLETTTADKLIIWGHRHGATIASYLVTRLINPIHRLVLDTPIMRYSDDIRAHLGAHIHDPVSFIQGTFRTANDKMDLENYINKCIAHTDVEYLQEGVFPFTPVNCVALIPSESKYQYKEFSRFSHFINIVPLTNDTRTSLFIDQHRIHSALTRQANTVPKLLGV